MLDFVAHPYIMATANAGLRGKYANVCASVPEELKKILEKPGEYEKSACILSRSCAIIIELSAKGQYAAVAQLDRVTGYEPVGRGVRVPSAVIAHRKSPDLR